MADNFTFFAPQRYDFGADAIERGYAGLGQGLASGINAITRQKMEQDDYKMKRQLEKQMQMDEENRKRGQALSDQFQQAFPGEPVPTRPDGSINDTAVLGKLGYYNRILKPLQEAAGAAGVDRPTQTDTVLPSVGAFNAKVNGPDQAVAPEATTINRPGSDQQWRQAIIDKNLATAAEQKAKEDATKLAATTKEKADAARQTIISLKNEFQGKFDNVDPDKLNDQQVLGTLAQMTGQAAKLRQDETLSRTQKNIDTKAQIFQNLRGLKAEKDAAILAGKPVPEDWDVRFNNQIDRYNAARSANDLVSPVLQNLVADASKRPINPAQAQTITAGITSLGNAKAALAKIDEAAKALGGADKLEDYFGLGYNQLNDALSKIGYPDAKRMEALQAMQSIEQFNSDIRNKLFGSALTEQEVKKFEDMSASRNRRGYIALTKNWIGNANRATKNNIKAISDAGFYVPDKILSQVESGDSSVPSSRPPLSSFVK